jgi:DNA helicase-2/ATP-dependent DNA helicase PcrA
MIDLAKHLNPAQLEVARTLSGALLVIAGAGSGKTRVIEYRVLNLIQNKILPQQILLLTFTRRAAREMLSRAASHDPRCDRVEGGTFHSFAYQILKKHSKLIGFTAFSILDEDEAQEAISLCAKNSGVFKEARHAPQKDTLRKVISMSVNKELEIDEVLKREYPGLLDHARQIQQLKNIYFRYKIDKGYFDYDDLLVYFKLLLEKSDSLRNELSQRYRYIMVDEYQDTNRLQAEITYLLGKDHGNVMVVGDDAQSIYGFRGASHGNIMEFPRRFPGCKTVKLETNYRSQQRILDVANAILKNMKDKFSKTLVSALGMNGEKPQLVYFRDAYEEASWISFQVLEFLRQGIALGHQAVLFRSAYVSIPLQMELSRQKIPFQVFGGLKFYETAHVKDMLAHLKVAVNPRDELSWLRLLKLLDGIGQKSAEKIVRDIDYAAQLSRILAKLCEKKSGYKNPAGLKRLSRLLEELCAKDADSQEKFASLLDYYRPIMEEKFDDWPQRLNDLKALKEMAMRYARLEDFLAEFTIEPPEKSLAGAGAFSDAADKPLVLSTIHSAKGLEWESVFLTGLAEGMLPVSFSLDDPQALEEEQRLFYVGVTRAKQHLILSMHHQARGFSANGYNKVSRFLDQPDILARLKQSIIEEEAPRSQEW